MGLTTQNTQATKMQPCNTESKYKFYSYHNHYMHNCIGGVMVVLALSVVDCGFETRLGQTKAVNYSVLLLR